MHASFFMLINNSVPCSWFLTAYVCDVWSRLSTLQASVTSTFGTILKIDSTKNIVKKLHGSAANSASWATNVGNERGEVLISVLTQSESIKSLSNMANGLVDRYIKASVGPPFYCTPTETAAPNRESLNSV